jgi:hypothetical protein
MRLIVAFGMMAIAACPALAQPVCNGATGPTASTLPCFDQAVNPQPTDLLFGTQATGPTRTNQSVKVSLSQVIGMDHSNAPVTSATSGVTDTLASWTGYLTGNSLPYTMSMYGATITRGSGYNSIILTPAANSGYSSTPAVDVPWDVTDTGSGAVVYNAIRAYGTVRGAGQAYAWPILGVVDYVGSGNHGQLVPIYGQGIRRAAPAVGGASTNPQIWGGVFEARDHTNTGSSSSNALISIESDLRVNNVDSANNRQGVIQVLSSVSGAGVGVPAEASRAYGSTTGTYSQWKKIYDASGNYQTAAIDTRSAQDNGNASGGRPTVVNTLGAPSQTIDVSNVMPFTSDWFGRDVNSGFAVAITVNGVTYTQDAYTITGNGPAGTLHFTTNVTTTDGTAGNPVRNASHTVWLGSGQDIAFSSLGGDRVFYDSSVNSLVYQQGSTRALLANSAAITASVPLKLRRYTVGTLPTCNSNMENAMAVVSDATAPTYNGVLTGAGSVIVPVFCDGTAWTSH